MALDARTLAVPMAGFAAFVNLYSPQALLPTLAHEFSVSAGEISTLITAATVAIALTAPFTGALADVLGRKRLITAAMFAMLVPTLWHDFGLERAAAHILALRPRSPGAADLHRLARLYRRGMAARRCDPHRRALYGGIETSADFAAGSSPAGWPT